MYKGGLLVSQINNKIVVSANRLTCIFESRSLGLVGFFFVVLLNSPFYSTR